MFFFGFLVGLTLGWLLKYAMDFYHDFKTVEKVRADQLEEVLLNWRLMEKETNKKAKPL